MQLIRDAGFLKGVENDNAMIGQGSAVARRASRVLSLGVNDDRTAGPKAHVRDDERCAFASSAACYSDDMPVVIDSYCLSIRFASTPKLPKSLFLVRLKPNSRAFL